MDAKTMLRVLKSVAPLRMVLLTMLLSLSTALHADSWSYWGSVPVTYPPSSPLFGKLASDGTNLYYATLLDGIYRASMEDHIFTPMPMAGFPLWTPSNTNGFALWNVGVTAQGTVVISGSPVTVTTNGVSPPVGYSTNTVPVFYYWDEPAGQWQAASVSGKSYPYTASAGNFSVAPDGALWTCSGFASYAYRSTDGGRSYVAFDINARVPTNYFPLINGLTVLGKVFGILATPKNEIIVGTETGGFLRTTNNGQTWASLDSAFTNTNSVNPLGRIGNAGVLGYDRYGNVLCQNSEFNSAFPGAATWTGTKLIGFRSSDGSYFKADYGFPPTLYPPTIVTTSAGESFTYLNQNYLLEGGIYRSNDGKHWTQFNDGITALTSPFAPGITNAVAPGNSITKVGTLVFVGDANGLIYVFDSAPPPIVNRPPAAIPQNVNLWQNTPTNIVLSGNDLDGDSLTYTITVPPQRGTLTGVPPNLIYTPSNTVVGLDSFSFIAQDPVTNSLPAIVNLAIDSTTNAPPSISLLSPLNNSLFISSTNIILSATANDPDGVIRVQFDEGSSLLATITNPPYVFVWTNPPPGHYAISARATDKFSSRAWSTPVKVTVLAADPLLTIRATTNQEIELSWPLLFDSFYCESATTPTGPWSLVSSAPMDRNFAAHVVTLTNEVPLQFFRLMEAP